MNPSNFYRIHAFFPCLICPHPINLNKQNTNLQCLRILRLSAILSPISVQTGKVKQTRAISALNAITLPPTDCDPIFTSNISPTKNFPTKK